ncbi:MAG: sugar phosphate nucleotidyltransferase [archaeon]
MNMDIDVIIPLAGKGTRFEALSHYHKSLLPYKNKTVLQHIIDSLKKSDYNLRFIFVVNHKKEKIVDFLKKNLRNDEFVIVEQTEINGPLGAIYACRNHIKNPFLIHLGDMILKDNAQFLDFTSDFLGIQIVPDFSRWCMVDDNLNFYDKPITRPDTSKALSGLYFFKDKDFALECLNEVFEKEEPLIKTEYQFSQLLKKYVSRKKFKLLNFGVTDIGNIDDFLRINNFNMGRFFNSFQENEELFEKKSTDTKLITEYLHLKLLSEKNVYKFIKIPGKLDLSFQNREIILQMEKVGGLPIDYIYIFKENELEYYERLFIILLSELRRVIDVFSYESEDYSLKNILYSRNLQNYLNYIDIIDKRSVISHGDYHLGNMLFDQNKIYLVDPHGRVMNCKYYDLAKLLHSVIYDYNLVKFGLYNVNNSVFLYNEHLRERKLMFIELLKKYFNEEEIKQAKIICMLLFKTMQPLHKDNKEHVEIFEKIHQRLKNEIDNNNFEIDIFDSNL